MLSREQIQEVCARYPGPDWWVHREIPADRLANAREHWRTPPAGDVIAFADTTVFGSGKNGLAVLETGVVWHSGHVSRMRDSYTWMELGAVPIRECVGVQIGGGLLVTSGLKMERHHLAACLRVLQQLARDAGAPRAVAYVPEGRAFPAAGQPPADTAELQALLHAVPHKDLHVAPDVPVKKERNARDSMRIPPDETVLALLDATVWGGARNGVVVGTRGIYWRNFVTPSKNAHMTWDALARARVAAVADLIVLSEQDWVEPASGGQMDFAAPFLLGLQWSARARMPAEERAAAIRAAGEVEPPPPAPGEGVAQWHLAVDGQQFGPYDAATVGAMAAAGQVNADACHAWTAGMPGWVPLREVPELAAVISAPRPAPPVAPTPPTPTPPAAPQPAPAASKRADAEEEERIDVNTASVQELLVLPGMTLAGAEQVVRERGTRGGFTDADQVGQLLRLRPHDVERMRGMVTFSRIATPRGRLVDF
jgi:hypothetical protein